MEQSDWDALKDLLEASRDKLLPAPPKPTRRMKRNSEEFIAREDSWQESCEVIDDLLNKFYKWHRETKVKG